MIEETREVPSVFIDMPNIEGFEDLDINGNVSLEITGKVKSLFQNEQSQNIRIEISDVKITSKEKNTDSLTPLRRAYEKAESEKQPIPSPSG